jgi:transposase
VIIRGWQARLYPTAEQAHRLNQWAGSLRFLWNRLLDREKTEYEATGKFLWRKQLQPIAIGMKRQVGTEWLADLPAHAVLDTATRMDATLRRMVNERKAGRQCGFPKVKKKFVNEAGPIASDRRPRSPNKRRACPRSEPFGFAAATCQKDVCFRPVFGVTAIVGCCRRNSSAFALNRLRRAL